MGITRCGDVSDINLLCVVLRRAFVAQCDRIRGSLCFLLVVPPSYLASFSTSFWCECDSLLPVAAGVVFGWSALVPPLRSAGLLMDLCDEEDVANEGEDVICSERTFRFAAIFIVGSLSAPVAAFFTGFLNDKKGPRATQAVALALAWTGWTINIFALRSSSVSGQSMFVLGFLFVGSSAVAFLIPVLSIGNLFPGSEAMVASVLNGLFDASSVIFVIFSAINSAGVSLEYIFAGYMLGPLLVAAFLALFLWPNRPFARPQRHASEEKLSKSSHCQEEVDDGPKSMNNEPSPGQPYERPAPRSDRHDGEGEGQGGDDGQEQYEDHQYEERENTTPELRSARLSSAESQPDWNDAGSSHAEEPRDAGDVHVRPTTTSSSSSRPSQPPLPAASRGIQVSTGMDNAPVSLALSSGAMGVSSSPTASFPPPPQVDTNPSEWRVNTSSDADDALVRVSGWSHISGRQSSMTSMERMSRGDSSSPRRRSPTSRTRRSPNRTRTFSAQSPHMVLDEEDGDSEEQESPGEADTESASDWQRETAVSLGGIPSPHLGLPLRDQLLCKEYLCYLAFQSIHILRFSWHISAAESHLEGLETDDTPSVDEYLTLLGIILPLGAVGVFASGYIMDKYGTPPALFILTGLGICLSAVSIVPVFEAQLGTFSLIGLTRAFTFSIMAVYIPVRFGFDNFGVLYGLSQLVGGVAMSLQFAFLAITTDVFGGNFQYVNGFMLFLGALQLLFPVYLLRTMRAEEEERKEQATTPAPASAWDDGSLPVATIGIARSTSPREPPIGPDENGAWRSAATAPAVV